MRRYPSRVEDYTVPFLVTAGLILFVGFFTLAALKGFTWVVLCAALIDLCIRLGAERSRRARAVGQNT